MKLVLNRRPSGVSCTIGELLVDGEFFCHTLEDVVREVPGVEVALWKVAGKTAIPAGLYPVEITFSVRFQRPLPLVKNVPGFDGIRIHAGNTDADTEGCILVGQWDGASEDITTSRVTLQALIAELLDAKDDITLEVCNP